MRFKFLSLFFIMLLFGCAGSPIVINSMSSEELSLQNSFSLCNAYQYKESEKVRAELERRKILSESEWRLIDSKYLQVGMSELSLICVKGFVIPGFGTVNETTTSSGISKQYVYEDAFGGRQYIYLSDGKVTSWQY